MVDGRCGGCGTWQPDLEYREQNGVDSGYCATCGELIDR
jgi:hypothetical protein